MSATRATSTGSYLLSYIQHVVTDSTVAKIGIAALVSVVAQVNSAIGPAFWYVILLWAVDFGLGVLKALADPSVELSVRKARHGLARLFAIPLITIGAALLEGFVHEVIRAIGPDMAAQIGAGVGGRLVMGALIAMAWQEGVSIQKNGRHFYRALQLRFRAMKNGDPKTPKDT